MSKIHPTAIIHSNARIDADVEIGPYAVVGEFVAIGAGTKIWNHATITGKTTLGKNNEVYPYCALGTPPQDILHKSEITKLTIGDNNIFRECVTVHTGTFKEKGETIIGNNNWLLAYAHVGHDSVIGNHTLISNGVQLGGHVRVEDYVGLGGLAGVHHFVTVGQHSFTAGMARVIQDVPPYVIVDGHPAKVRAVNVVGLERRGFTPERIEALENAYKMIWRSKHTANEALKKLSEKKDQHPEILTLIKFLQNMQAGKFGRYRESLR